MLLQVETAVDMGFDKIEEMFFRKTPGPTDAKTEL